MVGLREFVAVVVAGGNGGKGGAADGEVNVGSGIRDDAAFLVDGFDADVLKIKAVGMPIGIIGTSRRATACPAVSSRWRATTLPFVRPRASM